MGRSTGQGRRRIAVAAVAAVAVLVPASAPTAASAAPCANRDAHPSETRTGAIKRATLCLLNRRRAARGLKKLRHNRELAVAARRHAQDMVNQDFFAHTTPGGVSFVDRILRTDYVRSSRGYSVGENLAWGSYRLGTPRLIVQAWMRSPGHKRNILDGRFREIGIGVVRGAPQPGVQRAATYATTFGRRV